MVLHILVADSHVVRILRCEPRGGVLEELLTFYNSEAKLPERDLVSDRAGRVMNRPAGVRQAYAPRLTAAQRSMGRWLTHLARRDLHHVIDRHHSDGLMLVATAHVLAYLRAGLAAKEFPPVLAELPRNLARHSVCELQKRLHPKVLEALKALRMRSAARPKLRSARRTRISVQSP